MNGVSIAFGINKPAFVHAYNIIIFQSQSLNAGYLETAPFDAKAFANQMITSSHFETVAQQPLAALSEPAFHELYRDIALLQKWVARKDGEISPLLTRFQLYTSLSSYLL